MENSALTPVTEPVWKPGASKKARPLAKIVGIVLLSLATGFGGAWLFAASGWAQTDASKAIDNNKQQIVLQEGEIVADVFKQVNPSTVSIITEAVTSSPYSRYFNAAPQVSQGAGSGIVISRDGYILTNKHVVPDGVNKVSVIMADGKEYKDVEVTGRDPFNDVAFLKIKGVGNLKPAVLGDSSQVSPGQKVMAIGNALGQFRNSVTSGIISGIGRPIQAQDGLGASEQLENLFQTDAAINPGNSGGPLVNLKGEVIGINTAVSEEGQAIGFAIPINDAKGLVSTVLKEGKIIKPYLGVRYVTLDPDTASAQGLPVNEGALVAASAGEPAVIADSPAAKAGIKSGDIIIKVDDKKVTPSSSLASLLAARAPGDKVKITIMRDKKEQVLSVTLEAYRQ